MSTKLTRVTQLAFGSTGPAGDFGQFGSKYAGNPTFTQNPATIQALPNFLDGWGQAIIGNYEPPMEDMNSLFLLTFYQIGYILQMGLPEYDSNTVYFLNSQCQYNGVNYQSLANNNQGNEPDTSPSSWQCIDANAYGGTVASASSITLPNTGNVFKISGTTTINNISILPAGMTIELIFTGTLTVNTGGNILLNNGAMTTAANASLTIVSDGTNWFEISRSPAPQATGFGAWVAANTNQVYGPVTSDGFVVGYAQQPNSCDGYTDSNNPPTTVRVAMNGASSGDTSSFTMPVRKGDYWEVTGSVTVLYWLPLGV